VPKGNGELVKLGAKTLQASELNQIEDLPEWLRLHAEPKAREQDLFG